MNDAKRKINAQERLSRFIIRENGKKRVAQNASAQRFALQSFRPFSPNDVPSDLAARMRS